MANLLCNRRVDCPGSDSPIANLSAEGVEGQYWRAVGYCCNGAVKSYYSNSTFQDALLGLQRTLYYECSQCPPQSRQEFCSTQTCADGTGSVTKCSAFSQADADLAATIAAATLPCDNAAPSAPVGNDEITVTITINFIVYSYTIPRNIVYAATLEEANDLATQIATDIAESIGTPGGGGGGGGGGWDGGGGGPADAGASTPKGGDYNGGGGLPDDGGGGGGRPGNGVDDTGGGGGDGGNGTGGGGGGGVTIRGGGGISNPPFQDSSAYIILGSLTSTACAEDAYLASIAISSNVAVLTIAVTAGSLPPGLTLLGGTTTSKVIVVSGTPTTAGTYTFTVRALDSTGRSASRSYTISILKITTDALPDGRVGDAYSTTISAIGPDGTLLGNTWALTSGTIPPGLTLNSSTGDLTGTPTASGDYTFTVSATNTGITCSKEFSVSITACPTPAAFTFTPPTTWDNWKLTNSTQTSDSAAFITSQVLLANNSQYSDAAHEIDLWDFTLAVPVRTAQLAGGVADSHSMGMFYDEDNDLIVSATAIGTFPAFLGGYAISFFDPTIGFLSSITVADSIRNPALQQSNTFCRMPGVSDRVAMQIMPSYSAGEDIFIVVINTANQTIDYTIVCEAEVGEIFGNSGFCYSCRDQRFYHITYTGLPTDPTTLVGFNAATGAREVEWAIGQNGLYPSYVDSTGDIAMVNWNTGQIILFDTSTGTVRQTITGTNAYVGASYSFKLDRVICARASGGSKKTGIINPHTYAVDDVDSDNFTWHPYLIHDSDDGYFYLRSSGGYIYRYLVT